jgi:hypothetical protein
MAREFKHIDGVNRLIMRFEEAAKGTEFQVVSTLDDIGDDLLENQSKPVTPYEHGPLRDSGYYGILEGSKGPVLEVGYDTPYALRWHEELAQNYTTPGTGPKYLEGPFIKNRARYARALMDSARKLLRGR